jgi:hypothetical protein
MKKEYPTPDPRLARHRIRNYVKATGERSFTFTDVCVQPLTLRRLEDAGLIEYLEKESAESITPVYHLPECATARQESRFRRELVKIRAWSRATGQYTFAPVNIGIHGNVLEKMANSGLLVKTGLRYTVFWRSLSKQWRTR